MKQIPRYVYVPVQSGERVPVTVRVIGVAGPADKYQRWASYQGMNAPVSCSYQPSDEADQVAKNGVDGQARRRT